MLLDVVAVVERERMDGEHGDVRGGCQALPAENSRRMKVARPSSRTMRSMASACLSSSSTSSQIVFALLPGTRRHRSIASTTSPSSESYSLPRLRTRHAHHLALPATTFSRTRPLLPSVHYRYEPCCPDDSGPA